jgi:hypothetical protein
MLDDGSEVAMPMAAPSRSRRAAPTQQLYALPRREEAARPTRMTTPLPAAPPTRNFESAYGPATRPAGMAGTRPALLAGGGLAVAAAVYLAVSAIVSWTATRLDDIQYGNPRTTHLDAVLGNGDSPAAPTHFIGMNLNRQVSILELPGGDISKAVAITGPYLFGDGEDLTPVKLLVQDINGDTLPDLLVTVKNEQLAYVNDKGTFRPITADEKTQIEQATK